MIDLVVTSCNHDDDYERRKSEYIESFNSILQIQKDSNIFRNIYVGENSGLTKVDYFDNYPFIFEYLNFKDGEKGTQELNIIKFIIEKYQIDKFIKLTGRYKILDNTLYNSITDEDFVGSTSSKMYNQYPPIAVHLGYCYFKSELFLDYFKWDQYTYHTEIKLLNYLKDKPNIKLLDYLGVYIIPAGFRSVTAIC